MKRIPVRIAASVASLETLKDVTPELATQIRTVWHTVGKRGEARAQIDRLFQTHGVEYLGRDKRSGEDIDYCNAGDTYSGTILFIGSRLIVGTIGDIVERGRIREEGSPY